MSRPSDKHSVLIAGHATSVTLEPEFWDALKAIAAERGQSLAGLIALVDQQKDAADASVNDSPRNLSSALRVFVLTSLKAKVRAE